ncbi:MAG: flagellar filament capping protein FliD [Lachnospiraceae bacterium]|nr:flagellar filament capping protein FliD [Lachnospiraceae bacterium]
MSIRITGMYSGLDTESIISELVSAQSVKKSKLVKAQTKHSWKQDAWKALNTKIFDFYTNTLSNMRYQSSYMKKTTKISNPNAISVVTSDSAVDGVRSVKVNQLAKGSNLTSGSLVRKDNVHFSGAASLAQLRKFSDLDNSAELTGSFRVMGAQGQYLDFNVNENTTINDVVDMIKSTGLNANFDQESQRIFIGSKQTGAANDFTIVANDEGGLNALAALGLLTTSSLANDENRTWAAYQNADGSYTDEFYKSFEQEVKKREDALIDANKKMSDENDKLKETNDTLTSRNNKYMDYLKSVDNGNIGTDFKNKTGMTMSDALENLYGDGGLFDKLKEAQESYNAAYGPLSEAYNKAKEAYDAVSDKEDTDQDKIDAKAALDAAQADLDKAKDDLDKVRTSYTTAQKQISDFVQDTVYGSRVQKEDENGPVVDDDGNPVYTDVRSGGLKNEYDEAKANGTLTQDMQDKADAINNLNDALRTMEEYKGTLYSNNNKIASNEAAIKANEEYMAVSEPDDVDNMAMESSGLREKTLTDCMAKVDAAKKSLEAAGEIGKESTSNVYAKMATASKVDAQDAIITIDGAEFTSMTNNFNVNGMTITALEETDKEITMTTSMDTDGIYDMIKNFFTEYNKLINEMDSLYNAESSKGYEPLTSEEKDSMSDDEIEEWEKKIKDSLLRRDSTLSSVSFSMVSILLEGAEVNGRKMYLSDFGINTLGYFKAKDNERNAYHIDGDSDDADTKANDDILKKMIANDPDTVMNFFTKLSNNLYDNLTKQMASNKLSSAFTVYNDKQMKEEYNDYKDKITKEEEKLNKMMDKWYKKFSQMEVAMSKLESRSSSLTSILGG